MPHLLATFRAFAALLAGLATGSATSLPTRPPAGPPLHRAADVGAARTEVVLRYYDVAGRTAGDLLDAMLRQGPSWEDRRFFGLTTSEVHFNYVRATGPAGCALRNVEVVARITITLPRWTPPYGTPYELERDWRTFVRALQRHEDYHRQLIGEEAGVLRRMLLGLRGPTCGDVDAEAQQTAEAVRTRYIARHHDFDVRTGHGRTQGASWPVGR